MLRNVREAFNQRIEAAGHSERSDESDDKTVLGQSGDGVEEARGIYRVGNDTHFAAHARMLFDDMAQLPRDGGDYSGTTKCPHGCVFRPGGIHQRAPAVRFFEQGRVHFENGWNPAGIPKFHRRITIEREPFVDEVESAAFRFLF